MWVSEFWFDAVSIFYVNLLITGTVFILLFLLLIINLCWIGNIAFHIMINGKPLKLIWLEYFPESEVLN